MLKCVFLFSSLKIWLSFNESQSVYAYKCSLCLKRKCTRNHRVGVLKGSFSSFKIASTWQSCDRFVLCHVYPVSRNTLNDVDNQNI